MITKEKICIITARGGSKRIPRKNIRNFCGKPIIAYSIETAVASGLFDEIMVSTDDPEIAETSQKYGASVPFMRSAKNSDDYSTTAHVLLEVLEEYQQRNQKFDFLCCIYPTAPLLRTDTLKQAWELLQEKKLDSVFPMAKFGFPIQRALRMQPDGRVAMFHPENYNTRSQDLEAAYQDAGQFYFMRSDAFILKQRMWTDNTSALVLPEIEVQDIDNEDDWKIAEFKYTMRQL